jgi:gliding motility-associated-like protein
MKRLATTLLFSLSLCVLFAQLANDDCAGIIPLGVAPICPGTTTYTNVDATESNIGNDNFPSCFNGTPQRDVWFSFFPSIDVSDYVVTISGTGASPMTMPQVAVYRGDCEVDGLVLLDCATASLNEDQVSVTLLGLSPGLPIFLRVNDWSATGTPNWGTFEICIGQNSTFTIDMGATDLCSGELYDTGGPTGNYGNNENNVFTICPDDPQNCIVMNVLNYNFQANNDQIFFYDGPNTSAPQIATITGGANGNTMGGVCFPVVATSGCLTVRMTTNGTQNFEGFAAEWHCTDDCPQSSPLQVTASPAQSDLAAAIHSPQMDISVLNVNCNSAALGVFQNGDNTSLGLGKGILLTTGRAADAANPASFFANTDWGLGGDPDLNFLNFTYGTGSQTTDDACVVEMEIVAKTDRIAFDYVFGSDEYKQTFSPNSNDLIGILISGPGIPGLPGLNFQENLAFLPNTTNLIEIQEVNASSNREYYRNNTTSQTIAYNGLVCGFMGQPKHLTAARQVQPCETYRVKFAIGDIDENDDSGLFLSASATAFPQFSIDFLPTLQHLTEGCQTEPNYVTLLLPEAPTQAVTYTLEYGGTAIPGEDYSFPAGNSITFQPGETTKVFPIMPLLDGTPAEPTETIVLALKRDFGCGEVEMASIIIEIKNFIFPEIYPESDTIYLCEGDSLLQLNVTGAATFDWMPPAIFDDPTSARPTATITTSQEIAVFAHLNTCGASDYVWVEVVSPEIDITASGDLQLCEGESVTLSATNNVGNAGLTWSPATGLSDPFSPVTTASPGATTTYTATVTAAEGCSASDQITVNVTPFDYPAAFANDTTICQNSSVQLATPVINNAGTTYTWTPAAGLDNPASASPIATPDVTTTYTLVASDPTGVCTGTESVTITVLAADVDITPDTIEICLGASTPISAASSTGGAGLTWSPLDSLTIIGPGSVVVNPSVATWYVATLNTADCVIKDSVFVRVDSLPDLTIEAIPAREMYCEGEIITLISPNYDLLDFLDIEHQWTPDVGVLSADTLFNLVIQANATTSYIRTSTNHACVASDTIEIIVVPVANITVAPSNPLVCNDGGSIQLTATADQPIDAWEWSPGTGLSCDDCPNPTAAPPGTLTYKVQGESMGCPAFATVTVTVVGDPVYDFPEPTVCEGGTVFLNSVVDPFSTYSWSIQGGAVFSNDPQPSVTPTQNTTYCLTISNGACPAITDCIAIEVKVRPDVTVNPQQITLCEWNTPVQLNASSPQTDQFLWSPAASLSCSTCPNPDASPTISTTYTVQAGSPGCTSSATVTVNVTDAPDYDFPEDTTVCAGSLVQLNSIFESTLGYVWKLPGGLIFSTEALPIVTPEQTTTYSVTMESPDCGFRNVSFTVNVLPEYELQINADTTVCQGETITLMATTTPVVNGNFVWSAGQNGDKVVIDRDTTFSIVFTDTPLSCQTYEALFNAEAAPPFSLDEIVTVDTLYEGDTLDIEALTTPQNLDDPLSILFFDNNAIAETSGLNISTIAPDVNAPQTFTYKLKITDQYGCMDMTNFDVFVRNSVFDMPHVFTPDDKEPNNFFLPVKSPNVEILEFKIWDRWGKMVYNNETPDTGWDGKHKGEDMPIDVYVYMIKYVFGNEEKVEKGDVSLLR